VGGGCGGAVTGERSASPSFGGSNIENATPYTALNEIYEDKTINIIRETYRIGNGGIIGTTALMVTADHVPIYTIYL